MDIIDKSIIDKLIEKESAFPLGLSGYGRTSTMFIAIYKHATAPDGLESLSIYHDGIYAVKDLSSGRSFGDYRSDILLAIIKAPIVVDYRFITFPSQL